MKQIQQHFAPQDESIFARERATAGSYLDSTPQQFAFIHFVAHGVASRTDPLDSAIILSRSTAAEDSFKLHAREIISIPSIAARYDFCLLWQRRARFCGGRIGWPCMGISTRRRTQCDWRALGSE